MRKIYLEGQLGQKFGTSHLFCGETPADAFRLLQANYPSFRKYLIECHENDIAFNLEVNNEEVNPLECLLPLSQGDIVVAPVPAGSKSGGAKIAAAVALYFVAPYLLGKFVYGQQIAMLSGAGSTTAINVANAAIAGAQALAVNLALTGIQQLMAPDPSVDNEQEGYLFNGEGRTTVEGEPIPILYGELRIPGSQVSLEVGAGYNYSMGFDLGLQRDLNLVAEYMTDATNSSAGATTFNSPSLFPSFNGQSQNIVVTHVISEGQIYGLVDRERSIYLDNDPAVSLVANDQNTTKPKASSSAGSNKVATNKQFQTCTATVTIGTATSIVSSSGTNVPGATNHTYVNSVTLNSTSIDLSSYTNTVNVYPQYELVIELPNGKTVGPFSIKTGGTSSSVELNLDVDLYPHLDQFTNTSLFRNITVWQYTQDNTSDDPDKDTNIRPTTDLSGLIPQSKYYNFGAEFRTGTLDQAPLISFDGEGTGNSAITKQIGDQIEGPGIPPGSNAITNERVYDYAALNLSLEQAYEVDEVRFLFAYDSLINYDETGGKRPGKAWYNFYIAFSTDGGTTYGNYKLVLEKRRHYATSSSRFTIQDIINVLKFKQENGQGLNVAWKIRIERLSENDLAYEEQYPATNPNYTGQSSCSIVSATSVIKEFLNYPFTSMAKVQFNSKDFSGMPDISYHCRGMLVKVPSNYVTREENEELNGYTENGVYPAMYNRNSSGTPVYDVDSTPDYQDWTGDFRSEKVYTNNPAWVFYDILINNRYGLGNWISETDIDKYALYRIARYCDELVPDGKGGYEPRFTTNVYFTSFMDAYKTVKDLATVFRGMLYWINGEILGVLDQASDPVYNFSNVNVIDGVFKYESTGNRVRPNQIGVTWNNPVANYKQEVLLIEDGENIAKTGKLNYEEAVAFGATSEGQALRYGRWKLWTAKNQTELASFKTSINAAFLQPGDIINIQDHYRRPGYSAQSGRVSATGTLSTTSIPLDRDLYLDTGTYDYELSVLLETPGTFCSQASAIISGITYNMGDLIPSITTEADANNLTDDSGDIVQTVWKPYTRVETRPITNSSGNNVRTLTVGTAFSDTPEVESVWVLRTLLNNTQIEVYGSKQEYKILNITQDSDIEYSIVAVRHYNEKFDAVDNEFTLTVQDPVFPLETVYIPAPSNVYVFPTNLDNDNLKNDVVVTWENPVDANGDAFSNLSHYMIYRPQVADSLHFISDAISTMEMAGGAGFGEKVSIGETKKIYKNLPVGTYGIGIQSVSTTGRRSEIQYGYVTISNPVKETKAKRRRGVVIGGVSTSKIGITDSSGNKQFQILNKTYSFVPDGATDIEILGVANTLATHIQDISAIPQISISTWQGYSAKERIDAGHFILMKYSDTSDPIKLIKWYDDSALGIGYWRDAGTGNTYAHWSAATGTISISANSNIVTGSSTLFTSEFQVGDTIRIGTTRVATISYISSNTVMFIEKSFTTSISGETVYYPSLRIDRNNDAIIAGIVNLSTGWRKIDMPGFSVIEDPEGDGKASLLVSDIQAIRFDSSGSVINASTNITLTATAVGFVDPVFKITGAGFNNAEVSESAQTTYSDPTTGNTIYSFNINSNITTFDEDGLEFIITIKERNNDTIATQTIVIPMLQDGQDGAQGVTGPQGTAGVDGLIRTSGYVYYKAADSITSLTGPGTSASYTWSNGTLSGMNSGWTTSPAAMEVGYKMWYSYYTVVQTSSSDTSNTPSFGTPTIGTQFDGLVTFANGTGDFEVDGSPVTNINGGRIDTGTINVASIASSSSTSSGGSFNLNGTGIPFGVGNLSATTYITSGSSNDAGFVGRGTANNKYGLAGVAGAGGAGGIFHNTSAPTDSYINIGHDSYAWRMHGASVGYPGTNALNAQLDYNGNLQCDGNITAYAGLSDIRLKDDIQLIEDAVTKCMALRGVTFEYKKDRRRATGLIAQEVRKVLPEVIYETQTFENPEENVLAINYGNMAGLFVEAIKELKDEISELKKEVRRLKDGSSNPS